MFLLNVLHHVYNWLYYSCEAVIRCPFRSPPSPAPILYVISTWLAPISKPRGELHRRRQAESIEEFAMITSSIAVPLPIRGDNESRQINRLADVVDRSRFHKGTTANTKSYLHCYKNNNDCSFTPLHCIHYIPSQSTAMQCDVIKRFAKHGVQWSSTSSEDKNHTDNNNNSTRHHLCHYTAL